MTLKRRTNNRGTALALAVAMLLVGGVAEGQVRVRGDVYGGGALANVGTDATVNILGGTVDGSVYGGGQGRKEGGGLTAVAAEVGGNATVNIGKADDGSETLTTDASGAEYYNTVEISGNIFGANNINGTPKGNVAVNIYHTKHTKDNMVGDYNDTAVFKAYLDNAGMHAAGSKYFALQGVYGGGNEADYTPDAGKTATVKIWYCDNTVKMVYGGGRAAHVGTSSISANTIIDVYGGRIDTLFAGGDGHTTTDGQPKSESNAYRPADINGDATATVHGGYYTAVFAGSNTSGTIYGTGSVAIKADGCNKVDDNMEESIGSFFGGGNLANITGNISNTIECGAGYFREVYGGANQADINGNVSLTIKGGEMDYVYGGSKGTVAKAANITGDVALTLNGGTIGDAFGGSNINGGISGTITVTVDSASDCHALEVQNVYGGGNLAKYEHLAGNYPVVDIVHGHVRQNVYGGGLGLTAVVLGNPRVTIGGQNGVKGDDAKVDGVFGNVYGGGNLAPVEGNTEVLMLKGTVHGSVYGGGSGSETTVEAAQVYGNATVTMSGGQVMRSIYGGGELASVGTIQYATTETEASNWNTEHLPAFYRSQANNGAVDADSCIMRVGDALSYTAGSGKTTVTISGGTVGDISQVDHVRMPFNILNPGDDDYGYVFAACKGKLGPELNDDGTPSMARKLAVSGEAELEISGTALITASVYGGSENGQVLGNTKVSIRGGQIGAGYNPATNTADGLYSDAQWTVATTAFDTTAANPIHPCDASPYTSARVVYDFYATEKDGDKYYYDAAHSASAGQGSASEASNGHSFFGNVFGGGSGYYPYAPGKWRRTAGRVLGNTVLEITGGHVLTGVYGGNEITDVIGSSTVRITGGTVGVPRTVAQMKACPVNSNVYGGGMGDPRTWANQWSNVESATVEIGGSAVVFGSVFGGGEDGHVLANATTTISGNATIGTFGSSGVDGNVFGGGRGFSAYALTAGVVRGNVTLNIEDDVIIKGSVYGGGRLAAVGTPLVPDPADGYPAYKGTYGVMQDGDGHGKITINISGGTIGNEAAKTSSTDGIGNVFGGSKGTKSLTDNEFNQRLGLSKNTTVNITGNTTKIIGNVYGGGELASVGTYVYANQTQANEFNEKHPSYGSANDYIVHAEDVYDYGDTKNATSGLAKVTVSGGTIGVADETIDDGTAHREKGHTRFRTGHVYGAGLGKAGYHYSGYTFVRNTEVTITGTASIVGSVFGGGENGHVWGGTHVEVKGGQVGQEPDATEYEETNGQGTEIYFGNVYGGGRGIDNTDDKLGYSVSAGRVRGDTKVEISGGRVTHNVYGGGSLANTGFPTDDDTKGLAKVTISGGIIGYTDGTDDPTNATYYARAGKNGGRVYGSARGLAGSADGTLAHMAFTRETEVTISGAAKVTGSVFGGGENGHVRQDTKVTIEGGTIGVPLQGADHQESDNGVGPTIYRGNVYGGGRGLDNFKVTDEKGNPIKSVVPGHTDEDSVSFSLTAGRVYGNAEINITGGQIYHHVYGGGSLASVGDTIHDVSGDVAKDILGNTIEGKYEFDTIGNTITRAYRQGDPITGTGTVTINVSGGVIGENGINEGRIYGSGRGIAGSHTSQYTHMAFTHNTVVNIQDGADIRGSVFGGGANGHVTQNTKVNVEGGTIGSRLALEERRINSGGTHKHIYRGNVYGGGRGVDPIDNDGKKLSISAGRVFGNTTVNVKDGTVRHNVYGGGSLASVGTYKEVSDDPSFEEVVNVEEYTGNVVHAYLQGTGKAIVNIEGGRIGPTTGDLLTDDAGNSLVEESGSGLTAKDDASQATLNDNFLCLGENEGSVYGSGRGVAYTDVDNNGLYTEVAFVKQTQVNIKGGEVVGSVFGGGENGHVRFDTEVNIEGGKIGGIPLHDESGFDISKNGFHDKSLTVGFTIPATAAKYDKEDASRTPGDEKDIAYKNIVELYELQTGVGKTMYRGNVYGGGRGIDHTQDESHMDYSVTAGRVYGNANVNIKGGIVYHHVYGGGSIASVGNYDTLADGTPTKPRDNLYGFEFTHKGWEKSAISATPREDTVQHGKSGTITVTVTGGQIGYTGINEGRIYCAGRGIAGSRTSEITHLAFCDSTSLIIKEDGANIPDIRGSVFGGGANGHVLHSTNVDITGGHIGWGIKDDLYTPAGWTDDEEVKNLLGYELKKDMEQYKADEWGTAQTLYRGNVYGGGRGVDPATGTEGTNSQLSPTAGRIYGNIKLHVGGTAHVLHNVYGGGSLASVGDTLTETETYTVGDGTTVKVGKYKSGGKATVVVDGGQIGWNGVDNNGQVYGSCRGMPASVGTQIDKQYLRMAYVHNTDVTIEGTAKVLGSVFGGGANGHVQTDTKVTIKGGTIGVEPPINPAEQYNYCGNVYGAGRGVDRTNNSLSMSAGYVRGCTEVNILGGIIRHNVYGGGSMAIVGGYGLDGTRDEWEGLEAYKSLGAGDDTTAVYKTYGGLTTVNIKSAVGYENDRGEGGTQWGGNVYGSSRGRANDFSLSSQDFSDYAYVQRATVNVDSAAHVWGNVYGGGENGHVDFGGTIVTLKNGTIEGSVFGGGKGSTTSPTAGIVDGNTQVFVGTSDQTGNTLVINGYVFGGNDAGSSPLGTMRVDVYRTAHTTGTNDHSLDGMLETPLTDANKTWLSTEANVSPDASYALKGVYGGGNRATVLTGVATTDARTYYKSGYNYKYITQRLNVSSWPVELTRLSKVVVHKCEENTCKYVYGGGKAADTEKNEVIIEGGRFYQVFAGGDGSETGTEANVRGNASVSVQGGIVYQIFGGSNTNGKIKGISSVTFDPANICELFNEDVFGGGNRAGGEGEIVVTIPCGTTLKNVYGCSNMADFTGDITLNIEGGIIERAFGGARDADIDGNVTVNITGGNVMSLYGGNNKGGNITGKITVNVDLDPAYSCPDGLRLDTVYGGGRDAAYTPTSKEETPSVNILRDTIPSNNLTFGLKDVFGGGLGKTATVTANPLVTIGSTGGSDGRTVSVRNNVYGGGSAAPVVGNPTVKVVSQGNGTEASDDDNLTIIYGSVFGGGLGTTATVTTTGTDGKTTVDIRGNRTNIFGNVYGGGNAGEVIGHTDVKVGEYKDD